MRHDDSNVEAGFAAIMLGNRNSINNYDLLNLYAWDGTSWSPTNPVFPNDLDFGANDPDSNLALKLASHVGIFLSSIAAMYCNKTPQLSTGWIQLAPFSSKTSIVPHEDHWAWIVDGAGKLYDANDGGLWRVDLASCKPDDPESCKWESLNTKSLETFLANGVGMQSSPDGVLLVGSQDNGIAMRALDGSWVTTDDYTDAGPVRFDPTNDSFAYTTYNIPERLFRVSPNMGATWQDFPPKDDLTGLPFGYYPPFVVHHKNGSRILLGVRKIYESIDRGKTWAPGWMAKGELVTAVGYGVSDDIWFADSGGFVFVRKTLYSMLSQAGSFQLPVVAMELDHRDASYGTAYLAVSDGGIWHTKDFGISWSNITGTGLPPGAVGRATPPISALAFMPTFVVPEGALLAGTQTGVFIAGTIDGANTKWKRLGIGLPEIAVKDIQINPIIQLVAVATFGRGVFVARM